MEGRDEFAGGSLHLGASVILPSHYNYASNLFARHCQFSGEICGYQGFDLL